jgi:predicted flavoprotein YhiN
VVEPRAGLVPLVFAPADSRRWCDLAGLSTEVVASAEKPKASKARPGRKFREKLLVTHRGLSGPAVLQVSSYWKPGGEVQFDLAPGRRCLRRCGSRSGTGLEQRVCGVAGGVADSDGGALDAVAGE